jgi:hypothetical protein
MWKYTWGLVFPYVNSLEYQYPPSILSLKNRNIIEKNANQCGPMGKKRKYIKKSKFEELEDILKE